jgi:predicted DNA-binding transcriptional regulator AlpA
MTNTFPSELLDTPSAAQYLGLSAHTLECWRWKGSGPPYLCVSKRCVRYRKCDLDKWLSQRLVNSTTEAATLAA